MSTDDQKLDVIRKLLAKAEKAATPEEATAYNAKAAEMMARHGVDAALLAATGARPDRMIEQLIDMTDPYSTEKAQLASWVGQALGCRALRYMGGRGRVRAVGLFGYESDIRRTEVLFTSLLLQATQQVVHQRPASWSGESVSAFRRTWLTGFATEIHRRLSVAEHAAAEKHDAAPVQEGPSAALVLADRRSAVEKAFLDRHPDLQPGRRRKLTGSGYASGQAAGRRAQLGQPGLRASHRSLES